MWSLKALLIGVNNIVRTHSYFYGFKMFPFFGLIAVQTIHNIIKNANASNTYTGTHEYTYESRCNE